MDRKTKAAVAAIVAAAVFVAAGIVTGRLWPLIVGTACAVVALILTIWRRS